MPAYPVVVEFEDPAEVGYAKLPIRIRQADKNIIDKAAALSEMDRAPFYRTVLLRVSVAVIKYHEAVAEGKIEPPRVNQSRAQHRKLRKR